MASSPSQLKLLNDVYHTLSESREFLRSIASLKLPRNFEEKRIQITNATMHVFQGMESLYPDIAFSATRPVPPTGQDDDDQEEYMPVNQDGPQEVYEPMTTESQLANNGISEDIYDDTTGAIQEDIYDDTDLTGQIPEDIYDDTDNVSAPPTNVKPPSLLPIPPPNSSKDPGYASTNSVAPRQTTPEIVAIEYSGEDISWDYDIHDKGKKKMKMSNLKGVAMKGTLEKLGGKGQNSWQKRVCVLSESFLYFYEKESSKTYNNRIVVPGYMVALDDSKSMPAKNHFVFMLTAEGTKNYFFRVSSEEDRHKWVTAIDEVLQKTAIRKGAPSLRSAIQSAPILPGTDYAVLNEIDKKELVNNKKTSLPNPSIQEGEEGELYEPFEGDDMIAPMDSDEEPDDLLAVKDQNSVPPHAAPTSPHHQLPQPPAPQPTLGHDPTIDTGSRYLNGTNGLTLGNVFVVMYDFYPIESDELQLQRGELIHIDTSASNEEWWFGEAISEDLRKKGTFGFCPANHLTQAFQVA